VRTKLLWKLVRNIGILKLQVYFCCVIFVIHCSVGSMCILITEAGRNAKYIARRDISLSSLKRREDLTWLGNVDSQAGNWETLFGT
jgi:hypothetical protein